ncbi:MAG: guanylate kinase [Alphaproteobacteria bacterium]|nr:guanylate kinase [Alphaproteobacteria bacterium]MBV9418456.1 guanylate kinase [Alphaproteobacteria bacterium]MBV9540890.1 guanylate kinase [Alphaproteobacteria bacterium]MBV9904028.1 guanylate kinase [Alphaproteobacteria bacterium]
MTEIKRRGLMLVLSSPSGAGKSTLARGLLASDGGIFMSISATTRSPRPNEVEGRDYFFVTPDRFESMASGGELYEHAHVFDHRYGTPKKPVRDALESGRDVLFDIDWQGTQQLKEQARDDLVSVFILPPGHDELERRLKTRAQDSDDVVARRMAKAAAEISHWPEYDYVIVNRDVARALTQVKAILEAERARRTRLVGVGEFVAELTR